MQSLLWIHLFTTLFMTGLIWFVQVVHYPLFAGVGPSEFTDYAARHQHLTGLVVILPMVVELGTAVLLAVQPDSPMPPGLAWLGLGLVLIIWASTFFLQVPEHARLSGGLDAEAIKRLVRTNWVRNVGWSLRSGVLLFWLSTQHIGVGHPS